MKLFCRKCRTLRVGRLPRCPSASTLTPYLPSLSSPSTFVQRLLQEHGEVHLSALGVACSSMVTVAEILKARK